MPKNKGGREVRKPKQAKKAKPAEAIPIIAKSGSTAKKPQTPR